MIDLACMKNMRPKTNMEPEHYPFIQDNSLQTCDCFGSMSVLKGVNSFFPHCKYEHSTDLLISVELKFHQVINGQSILNIVMDRDSAIVLCHLVLRTNLLSSALHQADALYICSPFGNWNSALSWNPR